MSRLYLMLGLLGASLAHATPSGTKWFQLPVSYRVFAHPQINGINNFSTNALPAVQAAFSTWSQPTCTQWAVTYGGTFTTPTGTAAVNSQDRINNVIWLQGSAWRHGSTTLGLTTTSFFSGSGEIIDADMEMNNNIPWSTSGSSAAHDVQSVVLHEAGHFLGLDHTTSSGTSVMFPSIAQGVVKRILTTADSNDVCNVYPGSPGGQGSPCGTGLPSCTGGRVCRGPAGGTSKICTVDCTSGQPCPSGYSCQNADIGKACLVPTGSPDLCKFCTDGSQCSTGNCVTDGRHNWCTISCTSSASCGAGYDCISGGSGNICAPTSACTNQCTSAAQCALGYDCVGGRCQATGKIGDRCETSAYCEPCGICIGNTTAAYCRACCGGQGQGGACSSCPNAPCTTGFSCQGLAGGSPDQVCVPNVGAGSCATCGGNVQCEAGLTCVGGRCHATCNPTSPGACGACYNAGGGVGYCACPSEVRYAGESCGPGANGTFAACLNGLVCVGQPAPVCRRTCVLGVSGSCGAGELCKSIDGQDVCVSANTPGSVCAACNNGSCDQGLTCFGGRCYQACSPSAPSCSCVTASAGVAVCACDDQRAGPNQACGFVPPSDIYTCQFGLTCIDGNCREECNLSTPSCAANTTCQVLDGVPYCLPPGFASDAGTTAPVDGGNPPPAPVDNGCGCAGAPGTSLWWMCLFGMWAGRRRGTG